MNDTNHIVRILEKHAGDYHPVIPFDESKERIASLDLSKNNLVFTENVYGDPQRFTAFIFDRRKKLHARYLVGGYRELREMYRRSNLFEPDISDINIGVDEPRTLHLGTDVWSDEGTGIYAPLGGMIHSFAFNDHFGDYGATIILQHQLETFNFYTLYGHLSLKDIMAIRVGQFITRGEKFAHFGPWEENGSWPPHLHFQLILDMGNYEGDYPGVCRLSEAKKYLTNSPDPDLLLRLNRFLK